MKGKGSFGWGCVQNNCVLAWRWPYATQYDGNFRSREEITINREEKISSRKRNPFPAS